MIFHWKTAGKLSKENSLGNFEWFLIRALRVDFEVNWPPLNQNDFLGKFSKTVFYYENWMVKFEEG